MATITIQGHDRNGWDTETIDNMEDVHAYLRHPHIGNITVYVGKREYVLPRGIGKRYEVA